MNPYLQLMWARKTRLGGLIVFAFFSLVAFERNFPQPAESGAGAFVLWLTLFPLVLGWALTSVLHESLHRPSAFLLPLGSQRLCNAHLLVVVAAAFGFGVIAHFIAPAIALLPATAWAALMLSFTMPLGPGVVAGGWSVVSSVMFAGLPLVFLGAHVTLRSWMESAPLAWSLASVAGAAGLVSVARSRSGLRQRALTPHTPYFSALFSTPLMRVRAAQSIAQHNVSHLKLTSSWQLRSIGWWMAALRFERQSEWGRFGRIPGLVLSSLVVVLLVAAVAAKPGTILPDGRDLWREPSLWSVLGIALLIQARLVAVPRGRCLYPLSRRSRAQTFFLGALAELALGYFVMLSVVLLVGTCACLISGRDFPWTGFLGIATMLATALPWAPFVQWGRLHEETRNNRTLLVATLAYSFILVPWASRAVWLTIEGGLSVVVPFGTIAILLGLIAATQIGFCLMLRRFYRQGDLIQRGFSFLIGRYG